MRFFELASLSAALASTVLAGHGHGHQHDALRAVERRRHAHHARNATPQTSKSPLFLPWTGRDGPVTPQSKPETGLHKRGGTCEFPSDAGLVSIPGSQNGGWALPPDQPCKSGDYCPYACPPGEMMAQWDPKATSYTYPASMNGGLLCEDDGTVSKPFPSKPYCVKGAGGIGVKDETGKGCAFCQTVLPGSESMLIPTYISSWGEITVPGTDYWCETAAHYYINPPGVSTDDGCIWGTADKPHGNWSPYVGGANQDASGNTFLKLGWNPKYTDGSAQFDIVTPDWGVKIECEGGGCNGLPCAIDPATHKVNEISGSGSSGAGDAAFCVVTVPKGSSANYVIYDSGNSGGDKGDDKDEKPSYPTQAPPSSSKPPPPPPSSTPKPETETSSTPEPTTSSTPAPTTSSTPPPSSTPKPTPSSSSTPAPTSSSTVESSSVVTYTPSSTSVKQSSYPLASPTYKTKTWAPHILQQNYTTPATGSTGASVPVGTGAPPSATSPIAAEATGAAGRVSVGTVGMVFGMMAAAWAL